VDGVEHNLDEFVDFWAELQQAHGTMTLQQREAKTAKSRKRGGKKVSSSAHAWEGVTPP